MAGAGLEEGVPCHRRALTEEQAASDRRAQFVGTEAYVEAGGVVTRAYDPSPRGVSDRVNAATD
ncbi:hypothetical protein GCM10007857_81550 [Bradyrhizobium iriomotense]|uniref:Uncharacterized protein n=1 Tax=Bradyrhizobium iriomotense TaxID=441950 RepID=A0ABQ6BBH7_9BRAD|nr:hypothetical protein GCM10007857_81550 [Bradyrhizobium iriomotense]